MKNFKILILAILVSFVAQGQNNKFSFGLLASPDVYYYKLNREFPGFNQKYQVRFNYRAGVNLQYNITEYLSIQTGFHYVTKGYSLKYNWILTDLGDPAIPLKSNFDIAYLGVPIIVTGYFNETDKRSFFISGGFTIDYLKSSRETSIMGDHKKRETEFLKSLYDQHLSGKLFSFELGMGMKYTVNDKIFATICPEFMYGFGGVEEDVALISDPASFGIMLGMHYNID